MNALGQANGLAISFKDDSGCFHAGETSPDSGQNQAWKCVCKCHSRTPSTVGATVELGDLNKEWAESWAIAQKQPDLKTLDAEAKAWLEKNK